MALAAGALLYGIAVELPTIGEGQPLPVPQSMVITDRAGNELLRMRNGDDRTFLQHDEIPDRMRQAIVAIEDRRFWTRGCIDPRALVRAALANIGASKSQGASTLTQQLVRQVYLSPEKTFLRKTREIMLACRLEHIASKNDILDLYVNTISFGQGVAGLRRASQKYFGKPPRELSLAQTAVLAALPQRPTALSPWGSLRTSSGNVMGLLPTHVRSGTGLMLLPGRSSLVLQAMHEMGTITDGEQRTAERELLRMRFAEFRTEPGAPYFALLAKNAVQRLLTSAELDTGGQVQTTLDPLFQQIAQQAVDENAKRLRDEFHAKDVAVIVANRATREVLAYVGNADYFGTGSSARIDMAQVPRQPGSSFKPIVYAAAMRMGLEPDSVIRDEPIALGTLIPHNYGGGYFGRMTIKDALARSRNIPAIKAYFWAGGDTPVLNLAAAMGATAPLERLQEARGRGQNFLYGWPLALGAAEVPLWQMVEAYTTLSDGGVHKELQILRQVRSWAGQLLGSRPQPRATQALERHIAEDLSAILRRADLRPPAWRELTTIEGMEFGIKTGTSDVCLERREGGTCTTALPRDTWALGFSKNLVIGVWVGNADGTTLAPLADGLTTATPVLTDILRQARDIRGMQ